MKVLLLCLVENHVSPDIARRQRYARYLRPATPRIQSRRTLTIRNHVVFVEPQRNLVEVVNLLALRVDHVAIALRARHGDIVHRHDTPTRVRTICDLTGLHL